VIVRHTDNGDELAQVRIVNDPVALSPDPPSAVAGH